MKSKNVKSGALALSLLAAAMPALPGTAQATACGPISLMENSLSMVLDTQKRTGALLGISAIDNGTACDVSASTLTFRLAEPAYVEFILTQANAAVTGFTASFAGLYYTQSLDAAGTTVIDLAVGDIASDLTLTLTNLLRSPTASAAASATNEVYVTVASVYFVPEPASLATMGLALAALARSRRRRA